MPCAVQRLKFLPQNAQIFTGFSVGFCVICGKDHNY